MSTPTFTHTAPQARDFSAKTRKALLRKGIAIVGIQFLPNGSDMTSGETGYCLSDGTIRTYGQVCALAVDAPQRTLVGQFSRFAVVGCDVYDAEAGSPPLCVHTAQTHTAGVEWAIAQDVDEWEEVT
jgi:hypothetical protein